MVKVVVRGELSDTRPHLEVRDLHALCASWPEYTS